jgi:uncharacterized sulfatase
MGPRYLIYVWKCSLVAMLLQWWPLAAAPAPNLVMIISDDHAWTDYGFMGHPYLRTPHLDRLARESLVFTRAYVPASLCCPSLASLITGRYPHQHKITSNDPPLPPGMTPAQFYKTPAFQEGREVMNRHLESVPTLPRLLKERGYWCLQTGKWWQGDYTRGGFTHGMTRGGRHGDEGLDIGRKTMQPIYDFIARSRAEQRPFMVWYAPMMPHDPHTPPERLLEKYRPLTPSLHVARYWAMVEWLDETVGELLQYLDAQRLATNTLVVYLADNGWIQSEDNPRYAPKSKQSPYDGGLRTPLMLRWPGKIRPALRTTPVSSVDVLPTLVKLMQLPPMPDLPGIDLLDQRAVSRRPAIFGECHTHNAVDLHQPASSLRWRWVVAGDWKLIVPHPANEPEGTLELYHLGRDPREQQNLASREPRRVARLQAMLDAWWRP